MQSYADQVDLNGKPIFRWIYVGFQSGNLNTWSTELTYTELWIIYESDSYPENAHIWLCMPVLIWKFCIAHRVILSEVDTSVHSHTLPFARLLIS